MNYVDFAARCAATRNRVCRPQLLPLLWAPQPLAVKPDPNPIYLDYRRANRPFRRAFRGIVGGERERKILMAVGHSNARAKSNG